MNRKLCKRKFTLIELLIVLVILTLLAALVGPALIGKLGDSQRKVARTQIELLSKTVKTYYLDMMKYPNSLEDLINDTGDKKWKGPYLEKNNIPQDPWGNDYQYTMPGQHGAFDIVCYGADGAPGGEDENEDINSWE